MTDKQLKRIYALFAGQQLALVHLSNTICREHKINPGDLAQSFDTTAEKIPESVANREVLQLVLNQIAAGIRGSQAAPEYNALMDRLLH
ncbi:MAG: hypothetical protein HY849_06455 [Nitrosomonadales bacterium]|nr:hypothetical protein [Nitrosomonadales bacterium]